MQPWLKPAQDSLRVAEDRFGPNHLWYREQLARLRDGDPGKGDKLAVQSLKMQNNTVELDVPGHRRARVDRFLTSRSTTTPTSRT